MAFTPLSNISLDARVMQLERTVQVLDAVFKGIHSVTQGWNGEKLTAAFGALSMTDASAPNNTIYFSTTANKLVYKDAAGVVNNLY